VLELSQSHLGTNVLAHGDKGNTDDGHGLMPQVGLDGLSWFVGSSVVAANCSSCCGVHLDVATRRHRSRLTARLGAGLTLSRSSLLRLGLGG
jgi:hypothetical protein